MRHEAVAHRISADKADFPRDLRTLCVPREPRLATEGIGVTDGNAALEVITVRKVAFNIAISSPGFTARKTELRCPVDAVRIPSDGTARRILFANGRAARGIAAERRSMSDEATLRCRIATEGTQIVGATVGRAGGIHPECGILNQCAPLAFVRAAPLQTPSMKRGFDVTVGNGNRPHRVVGRRAVGAAGRIAVDQRALEAHRIDDHIPRRRASTG